jgi:hypothetical protein
LIDRPWNAFSTFNKLYAPTIAMMPQAARNHAIAERG